MELSLQAGEEIVLEKGANRTQSAWRAVGGKLYLTNQRIAFQSHKFDKALGGQAWSAPLGEVASVEKEGINLGHLFGGGLRPRLRVELQGGDTQLFVVSKVDDTIEEIRRRTGTGELARGV